MPYIWQADVWCDSCGRAIIENLKLKKLVGEPIDFGFSDDYPQRVRSGGKSDSPHHCGSMDECLEAITLPSGRKVGALITKTLTDYGITYVYDTIQEGEEIGEYWAGIYDVYFEEEE